jgi:hypothetical protein
MSYSFEGLNGQFCIQYLEQDFFFALEKIAFLDFIHHPVFCQKHSVSETGSVSIFR